MAPVGGKRSGMNDRRRRRGGEGEGEGEGGGRREGGEGGIDMWTIRSKRGIGVRE